MRKGIKKRKNLWYCTAGKGVRDKKIEEYENENYYSLTSIKRPPIKRPPSIKRPLSKVPIYLSVICCTQYLCSTATSVKRPRPPFCCRKCIIYMVFLPPLSGQQIIFPSEMAKYLELKFLHINCWCKKAWETCQRCFTFFSVHDQLEEILYILTTWPLC